MRNAIIGFAALAALAIAGSASASSDTTNIQQNGAQQSANVAIGPVSVGTLLSADGQAVGNSVSVLSQTNVTPGNLNDARVSSAQINSATQTSTLGLDAADAGSYDLGSRAIGNVGEFASEANNIETTTWSKAGLSQFLTNEGYTAAATVNTASPEPMAFQDNLASQTASTSINGGVVTGDADSATVAVGNSLSFDAYFNASAIGFQNNGFNQTGSLTVTGLDVGGDAGFSVASMGNVADWVGNSADGIVLQTNLGAQNSTASVLGSNFGSLAVSGSAIGNAATITSVNRP